MKPVRSVPHGAEFNIWRARLTALEVQSLEAELHRLIDVGLANGDEVQVAGWMPGSDWTRTAWEPIYATACRGDIRTAALCFGLFAWKAFMDRPETWSFVGDATKRDGTPIQSKVYFRIAIPESH